MAEVILHEAYRKKLEKLEPLKQLEMIYAMMDYAAGKDVSFDDPVMDMMFEFLKDRIDADTENHKKASSGHSGAGKKGAEARWGKRTGDDGKNGPDSPDGKNGQAIFANGNDSNDGKDSILISKSISISTGEKESKEKKPAKAGRAPFVPPTVEEVEAYCRERKNSLSAQGFINYYQSNGWKVGKAPMKDWRAAVRTWEARDGKTVGTPRAAPKKGFHFSGERKTDYDAILRAELEEEARQEADNGKN